MLRSCIRKLRDPGATDARSLLSCKMQGSRTRKASTEGSFPQRDQLPGCYLSLFPHQPQNLKETASQPKPLRFFRKKNLSQNTICFQVASNGSVEHHTVLPLPQPLVFGRRGCWGGSPAASWLWGPTACCCCQTAGWGSAPHPGRLYPRSVVRRWPPGGTCSSVRCHLSATTPLPAV